MEKSVDAGDEQSEFARLYARLFQKIKDGIRAKYGNGPPDPEDIAQAAFEKLGARMRRVEIEDPEAYIWVSARNILLSEKRAELVRTKNLSEIEQRLLPEQHNTLDPERVSSASEQLEQVFRVLAEMPERRRNIFLLTRVHGLTLEQAGQRFGISRPAATRHVAIATKLLANALVSDPSHSQS